MTGQLFGLIDGGRGVKSQCLQFSVCGYFQQRQKIIKLQESHSCLSKDCFCGMVEK